MCTKTPQSNRCCSASPSPCGLLCWGYISLIAGIAQLGLTVTYILHNTLTKEGNDVFITITSFTYTLLMIIEGIITVMLLIGGHMRNAQLLNIYYWGFLTLFLLFVLNSLTLYVYFIYYVYWCFTHTLLFWRGLSAIWPSSESWKWILSIAFLFLFLVLINVYILVLVSREIRKLKNVCKLKFTNIAVEPVCTMTYKDGDKQEAEVTCHVQQ